MSSDSTHSSVECVPNRLAIALGVSVVAHVCLISLVGIQPQQPLAQAPGAIEVRIVSVTAAAVGHTEPAVEATESLLIASSDPSRPATAETDPRPSSRLRASQVEETRATSQRQAGDAPVPMMEEPPIATLQAPPPSGTTYYADSEVDAVPIPLDPIVPRYPSVTAAASEGGKVTLRLLIDATGLVNEIFVVDAQLPEEFTESARKSLASTHFKPAERAGEAVACHTLITVVYSGSVMPTTQGN
jgi:TonB family protein